MKFTKCRQQQKSSDGSSFRLVRKVKISEFHCVANLTNSIKAGFFRHCFQQGKRSTFNRLFISNLMLSPYLELGLHKKQIIFDKIKDTSLQNVQ